MFRHDSCSLSRGCLFLSRLSRLTLHLYFHLPFFSQIANPRLDLLRVGLSVFHKLLLVFGGCSTTSPTSPGFKENDLKTKKNIHGAAAAQGSEVRMFNGNFCIYFVHSSNCLCSASAFLISDTPGLFYFFGGLCLSSTWRN